MAQSSRPIGASTSHRFAEPLVRCSFARATHCSAPLSDATSPTALRKDVLTALCSPSHSVRPDRRATDERSAVGRNETAILPTTVLPTERGGRRQTQVARRVTKPRRSLLGSCGCLETGEARARDRAVRVQPWRRTSVADAPSANPRTAVPSSRGCGACTGAENDLAVHALICANEVEGGGDVHLCRRRREG